MRCNNTTTWYLPAIDSANKKFGTKIILSLNQSGQERQGEILKNKKKEKEKRKKECVMDTRTRKHK
jgi:hypothetical protein